MRSVYKKIKELRTQLHLSQEYVANYLGLSRSTYTQMENGKRKVLADEVAKLSALYGVSTDSLLNDTKGMTRKEAIEILKDIHAINGTTRGTYAVALGMAIEALQTEPVVRCKECRRRGTDECPMYWEEWHISEYGDDWLNMNDYSRDDGFCDWGEEIGGDDE